MVDIGIYRTGRAVRDEKRRARAMRLRYAYHMTGDHRKLKRARRIEQQLRLDAVRRLNAAMSSTANALRAAQPEIARAVQRISDAFAKLRTPTDLALIAAAQAKGREVADRIASQLEGAQRS